MSEAENGFGLPFEEAIRYFRQKISLPSLSWRDLEGRAHDRAFVIAGAMKEALLADLRTEIDKAIAGNATLTDFRKSFKEIVARHGWTGWTGEATAKGRAWRTRVIFETNLRTAYAAGRYAQMTDKVITKVYKWWRYAHGFYRSPEHARAQHKAWNGTVLAWDDPWWRSHYPPNGWGCSCGVETLSDRDLKDENLQTGQAPATTFRTVIDPKTGETVKIPEGIDFGWDHAPGQDWAEGLVPPELQQPLEPLASDVTRAGIVYADMPKPRSFVSPHVEKGLEAETYVKMFLHEFGADIGKAAMFRDKAGHAIPISDSLFRTSDGVWKVLKRGRETEVLRLAETLKDPDEIWVEWYRRSASDTPFLVRTYLRRDAQTNSFSAFVWSQFGWMGETIFAADKESYLLNQRRGALLYRWEK